MRGKKSRTESPLEEVTVDKTLVSSMPKTTAPLAKRAILPVSRVIRREPISNSSLKVSRTLVPATDGAGVGGAGSHGAKPRRPLQMVRNPRARHVRNGGRLFRSGWVLVANEDIELIFHWILIIVNCYDWRMKESRLFDSLIVFVCCRV